MKYKLRSQISENQIEADIASYLGYITPIWARRYRLLSVDEQTTGADKLFHRFLLIYMQFKVSQGLQPPKPIFTGLAESSLAKIIRFRRQNDLSGDPILYFQLRRQAKTANNLQHNILFGLNRPPEQISLYVAPLTLNIGDYEHALNSDWFMRFYPFDPFFHRELQIHDSETRRNVLLGGSPFLRNHISIPPHKRADTYNHHYSYSQSGGDVAWHGGELLSGDFRLSTQLSIIMNYLYNNRQAGMQVEQFADFITAISREYNLSDLVGVNDNSRYLISRFARVLRENYGIRLLILAQTDGDQY